MDKYQINSYNSFILVMMPATRSIRGQIVVALYTYQGSEFGDMTFKKGDMMEIVDDT